MELGCGWISSATTCDRLGPNGCWAILLEVISLTASPGYSLAGECPEETKQLHGEDCLKRESTVLGGCVVFQVQGWHVVLV